MRVQLICTSGCRQPDVSPRGLIRCVAAQQCGGELILDAAVAKGEVIEASHRGIRMYYFPQVRVRELESSGTGSVSQRSKSISDATHQDLGCHPSDATHRISGSHVIHHTSCCLQSADAAQFRKGVHLGICCTVSDVCNRQMLRSFALLRPRGCGGCHRGDCLPGGAPDEGGAKALGSSDEGPLPPTEMERASANAEELHRMVQQAETVLGKMDLGGPGFKSKWAHQMISTLQEAVPSAMSLRDDLRFLLKFKRDRSGVPLKLPHLMEVSDLAEAQAAEIADLVGSCRTLGRRS